MSEVWLREILQVFGQEDGRVTQYTSYWRTVSISTSATAVVQKWEFFNNQNPFNPIDLGTLNADVSDEV